MSDIKINVTRRETHTVVISEENLRLLVHDEDTPIEDLLDQIVNNQSHSDYIADLCTEGTWSDTLVVEVDDAFVLAAEVSQ